MGWATLLGKNVPVPVRTMRCGSAQAAWAHWQGNRDEQQDACGVFCSGTLLLGAVADGMGGLAQGALAAHAAIDACEKETETLSQLPLDFHTLQQSLLRVNRAVHEAAGASRALLSGTTLVAAVVQQDQLRLMWSGDSRAYLWRQGKLVALTFDHNYERQLLSLVAEGMLSEAQARSHPKGGHLTGYLGLREPQDYSISGTSTAILRGDALLLCTDGLYRTLGESMLCKYLSLDAEKAAGALIEAVVRSNMPKQDNATACVVKW